MNKRTVLSGHKKKGSKFIPPMMQLDGIDEVSYLNDALPNLIWMGLVFDRFGYKKGIHIISRFVSLAFKILGSDKDNYNFICYFSSVDMSKKSQLYKAIKSEGVLYPLQDAVAPLSLLFNNFPLLFLKPEFSIDKSDLIPRLKNTMKQAIDRFSQMSTAIQVTTLYTMIINDKLLISSNINIPDLNSVFDKPDSEESKRASSFARAMINGEIGHRKADMSKGWVRDFWIEIYKLENCETKWNLND